MLKTELLSLQIKVKLLARPALEQMDVSVSTPAAFSWMYPATLGTGNPALEPYESTNFDLAYEYYYKEGSYVAVNVFVKEIEGYPMALVLSKVRSMVLQI